MFYSWCQIDQWWFPGIQNKSFNNQGIVKLLKIIVGKEFNSWNSLIVPGNPVSIQEISEWYLSSSLGIHNQSEKFPHFPCHDEKRLKLFGLSW